MIPIACKITNFSLYLYIKGFDEVTIPNVVLEAILNGVAVLENASKSDSMCKNNGRVVTMQWVGNHLIHFSCNQEIIVLVTPKIALDFDYNSYIYSLITLKRVWLPMLNIKEIMQKKFK